MATNFPITFVALDLVGTGNFHLVGWDPDTACRVRTVKTLTFGEKIFLCSLFVACVVFFIQNALDRFLEDQFAAAGRGETLRVCKGSSDNVSKWEQE